MAIKKTCIDCGKKFIATSKDIRYCAECCERNGYNATVEKKCEICGVAFLSHRSSERKFCSRKCNNEYRKTLVGDKAVYKKTKIKKVCERCGKRFFVCPSNANARYCSQDCKYEERTKLVCEYCGKVFFRPTNSIKKRTFCSKKCWNKYVKEYLRVERTCEICGKKFTRKRAIVESGRGRFCSKKCAHKGNSGDKCNLWSGGSSFEPYAPEFNDIFKNKIRERDNFTCQVCGDTDVILHVHHIDYDKGNTSPENCISLCGSCHSATNHNREHWKSVLSRHQEKRFE